ncbi:zinc-binding dehydrogenase [Rhodoferax sp. AJA081-3]|uniref:zinc-binding dehydrogenase n=1 Tax=Rhodoferax sp. AJA081-3 TaxID=2752316 RepID=UPI001ADF5F8E|nr:zinc-binding dehydrogenase [Rhodoferax sp. AJA081-3]QTN27848.1 zinc-binding dehydrogenase [Rhodoferax sp. AJA081-3]
MAPALTAGRGGDQILELGGPDTYDRSIPAIVPGGKIAQIGVLTGFASQLQRLTQFIVQHQIHPVIDALFPFEEAPKAYAQLASS